MSDQEQIRLLKVALLSLWENCGDGYIDRRLHTAMINAGAVLRNLGAPDLILDAHESSQIDEQTGNVYAYGVWQSDLVAELTAMCVLSEGEDTTSRKRGCFLLPIYKEL